MSWEAGPTGVPDAGAADSTGGLRFHEHTDPGGGGDCGATVLELRGPRSAGVLHRHVVEGRLVVADPDIADECADRVMCPWVSGIRVTDAAGVPTFPTRVIQRCGVLADADLSVTDRDTGRYLLQYEGA